MLPRAAWLEAVMQEKKMVNAGTLVGAEALRQYESGVRMVCPVCSADLQSIPAGVAPGHRVSGLVCPTDQKHYLLYGEDEAAMKGMRALMKGMAAQSK